MTIFESMDKLQTIEMKTGNKVLKYSILHNTSIWNGQCPGIEQMVKLKMAARGQLKIQKIILVNSKSPPEGNSKFCCVCKNSKTLVRDY